MNTALDSLPDSSVDLAIQEQTLKLAKIKVRWNAHRALFAPIVAAFQHIGVEPTMTDPEYISVNMTGDKDALGSAFRILRGAGFKFSGARPQTGQTEWYTFFSTSDCPVKIWFSFTSSVCRRVKVGTKMVEQDIYEVQCGDLSDVTIETPVLPSINAVEAVESIPW